MAEPAAETKNVLINLRVSTGMVKRIDRARKDGSMRRTEYVRLAIANKLKEDERGPDQRSRA